MTSFGLILPTMRAGASAEVIEAGAKASERLGWTTVGRIYEVITTLAWVGARRPLRLGTSVIVVPQRNAVLAEELATLDA